MAKDHTTGILWITLSEQDVNHIFRKAARVKNSKMKLHSFFPHQVWDQKVTLQNLCLLEKKKSPDFKFLKKPYSVVPKRFLLVKNLINLKFSWTLEIGIVPCALLTGVILFYGT